MRKKWCCLHEMTVAIGMFGGNCWARVIMKFIKGLHLQTYGTANGHISKQSVTLDVRGNSLNTPSEAVMLHDPKLKKIKKERKLK